MSGVRLRIIPGSLRDLEHLEVEALALPLLERESPPRGIAGVVDGRLGGRIGRLISSGRFRARAGEALLTPGCAGLPAGRVFVLGLGVERAGAYPRKRALEILVEARVQHVALLPLDEADPVEDALLWLEQLRLRDPAPFSLLDLLDFDGRLERERARIFGAGGEAGLTFEGCR